MQLGGNLLFGGWKKNKKILSISFFDMTDGESWALAGPQIHRVFVHLGPAGPRFIDCFYIWARRVLQNPLPQATFLVLPQKKNGFATKTFATKKIGVPKFLWQKKHAGSYKSLCHMPQKFCGKKKICGKKCGKKPRRVLQTPLPQATKWFCHIRGGNLCFFGNRQSFF